MNVSDQLDLIEASTHIYAISTGSDVYFMWADDRERLKERLATIQIGLIGANLDLELICVEHGKLRSGYTVLCVEIGHDHIHFLTDDSLSEG